MKRRIRELALAIALPVAFTACSSDPESDGKKNGNGGSAGSAIAGASGSGTSPGGEGGEGRGGSGVGGSDTDGGDAGDSGGRGGTAPTGGSGGAGDAGESGEGGESGAGNGASAGASSGMAGMAGVSGAGGAGNGGGGAGTMGGAGNAGGAGNPGGAGNMGGIGNVGGGAGNGAGAGNVGGSGVGGVAGGGGAGNVGGGGGIGGAAGDGGAGNVGGNGVGGGVAGAGGAGNLGGGGAGGAGNFGGGGGGGVGGGAGSGFVHICPGFATLLAGESIAFTASVAGVPTTNVTYGATCGSVSSSGVFTAPASTGTCFVTATNNSSGDSATATLWVNPPAGVSLTGTISHSGLYPVYVGVGGYPDGRATALPNGPGAYKIRGLTTAPNGTIRVEAFMDLAGTGEYVVGVDPYGYADVNLTGSDLVANITLQNPGTPTIVDPTAVEVQASDGTLTVMFEHPSNSNGYPIVELVRVYARRNALPTPSVYERIIDVPARLPSAAFLTGLDPDDDWYFLVVSRSNVLGAESAGVPLGPASAVGPTPLYDIFGQVDSSSHQVRSPLMVFAMGGGVFIGQAIDPANDYQLYSLGVPANGMYECGAFIDRVNPGTIDLLDPKTFGLEETAAVIVAGADEPGPYFRLESGPIQMAARSEHQLTGGEERYSVRIDAVPNDWLPIAATFDRSTDGRLGPMDFMRPRAGELTFEVRYGTSIPAVGTSYHSHVQFENGVTCDFSAPLLAVLGLPQNPAPSNVTVTDSTPTFSWQAPLTLPASYTYDVGVFGGSPSTQIWSLRLPPGTLSVDYNVNNQAALTTLPPGTYTWIIRIRDAFGNQALVTSTFNVAAP